MLGTDTVGDVLQLAEAVATPPAAGRRYWPWAAGAAALLIGMLLLWLRLRRRHAEQIHQAEPWELALEALEMLRSDARREAIPPARGFAWLTDIVRTYLEARF